MPFHGGRLVGPLILVLAAGACGRGRDNPAIRAARAAEGPAPVIVVDQPVHDFGVVAEGGPARHLFKVRNTGKAPLEIQNVAASCGCTAAAPKERRIAPGGTGEIEVSFDTRGRSGKVEKTVTVMTNDPKNANKILTIKVDVQRMLGFEPEMTFLSGVAGEPVKGEAWLSGKLAGKARPKIVRTEPAGVGLKVELAEKPGGGQRGLRIQVPSGAVGQGSARVVLATGIADRPELEHQVSWSVRGNVEAPAMVFIDLGRPEMKERVFQVSSRRPDFKLRSAKVTEGPFLAEVVPGADGARPSIKLRTSLAQPPPQAVSGKLVLESNDPLEPKKQVALTVAAFRR